MLPVQDQIAKVHHQDQIQLAARIGCPIAFGMLCLAGKSEIRKCSAFSSLHIFINKQNAAARSY